MTLTSELMFRIAPFPDFAISGATIFRPRKSAVWLTAIILLQPSSVSRSEEHTSELQSLMRISYAVFCLKKKKKKTTNIRDEVCRTQDRINIRTENTKQIHNNQNTNIHKESH